MLWYIQACPNRLLAREMSILLNIDIEVYKVTAAKFLCVLGI